MVSLLGHVISYFFPASYHQHPAPYQQQLNQFDKDPQGFIFDETQVNEQVSQLLESIEWNTTPLAITDERAPSSEFSKITSQP